MSMACRPYSPPQLGQALLAVRQAFYQGSPRLDFVLGGENWRFIPQAGVRAGQWRLCCTAELGGSPVLLHLEDVSPLNLPQWEIEAPMLEALPPELAGAVLEAALEELCQNLEKALGQPLRITSLRLETEDAFFPEEGLGFVLENSQGLRLQGCLTADAVLALHLAQTLARHGQQSRADLATLVCPWQIRMPGPELSRAELAGLEVADVLLLPPGLARPLPVRLCAGNCYFAATLADASLTLESAMEQEYEQTLENPQESDEASAPVASPDALPLQVSFSLGSVSLSVGEAAALAPGQVLSTGRESENPVRILINGREVGTGSLVETGGRLGVQILSLHWPTR